MTLHARVGTNLIAGSLLLLATIAVGSIPVPALAQAVRPEQPATTEQLTPEHHPKREPRSKREPRRRPRGAEDSETARRQQQDFIDSVAAKLGISPERLNAAIKEARIDQVEKAVTEGKLSREQADRMIEQLSRVLDSGQQPSTGAAGPAKPQSSGSHDAAALSDIRVSFKLDPQLTRSLYMGDRWISAPTYTGVQSAVPATVDARASGVDGRGQAMAIRPQWTPADAEMVTVSPSQGAEVKITVHRAGHTALTVAAHGVIKELHIKATAGNEGKTLQVEISHQPAKEPAARTTAVSAH